ncbi:MAG: hypothetical protein LBJ84_00160, partial [Oscillospiraceae bacterium]|nr:hypothetical protein [Oscillospiraceae bacterium]
MNTKTHKTPAMRLLALLLTLVMLAGLLPLAAMAAPTEPVEIEDILADISQLQTDYDKVTDWTGSAPSTEMATLTGAASAYESAADDLADAQEAYNTAQGEYDAADKALNATLIPDGYSGAQEAYVAAQGVTIAAGLAVQGAQGLYDPAKSAADSIPGLEDDVAAKQAIYEAAPSTIRNTIFGPIETNTQKLAALAELGVAQGRLTGAQVAAANVDNLLSALNAAKLYEGEKKQEEATALTNLSTVQGIFDSAGIALGEADTAIGTAQSTLNDVETALQNAYSDNYSSVCDAVDDALKVILTLTPTTSSILALAISTTSTVTYTLDVKDSGNILGSNPSYTYTASSDDDNIAAASYDAGTLTVNAVAKGSATITLKVSVTGTDGNEYTDTATVDVTVVDALTLSATGLDDGTVAIDIGTGNDYKNQTITLNAAGGQVPIIYALDSNGGTLDSRITIRNSLITIDKDTNTGEYEVKVTATDALGQSAELAFIIDVNNAYDNEYDTLLGNLSALGSQLDALGNLLGAASLTDILGYLNLSISADALDAGAVTELFEAVWNGGSPKVDKDTILELDAVKSNAILKTALEPLLSGVSTSIPITKQQALEGVAISDLPFTIPDSIYNILPTEIKDFLNTPNLGLQKAYETLGGILDILTTPDAQRGLTFFGDLTSLRLFDKYLALDFDKDANGSANKALDYVADDLAGLKALVNFAGELGLEPENVAQLVGSLVLGDTGLTATIEGLLGEYIDASIITEITSTLKNLVDVGNSDLTGAIDKAIAAVQSAKEKLGFGEDGGVDLDVILGFAKSIIDGSVATKYEDLELDSLTQVETLIRYIKYDVDSVTEVVRLADTLDKGLNALLGGKSISDYALEYLGDTLPGLVDGLLELANGALDDYPFVGDLDFGALGIGGFVGEALGALATADFDATGTALAYLEGVSDVLGEVLDVFEEVVGLFYYDGGTDSYGHYITGFNGDAMLEKLGLDRAQITAMFDEVLQGAAASLYDILDNVGVDTYDVAADIREIVKELAYSADSFAKLRAEAEELYDTLGGLYDAAKGYLTESEILDILGDIAQYYGEDIEAAIWALLNGEGITRDGIATAIADITKEIESAIDTARHYVDVFNEIKSNVENFIDYISGITEQDVKAAAEALARKLAERAYEEIRQYIADAINESGIPGAIEQAIEKAIAAAKKVSGDLEYVYNQIKQAVENAREFIDSIDFGGIDDAIKNELKKLAWTLTLKVLDEISELLDESGIADGIERAIEKARAIAAKLNEVCETLKKVYEGVKDAIDTAKAIHKWLDENITEDNIRKELKKLAEKLEAKALQALRDMMSEIEKIKDFKIEAIKALIDAACNKLADICEILDDVYNFVTNQARDAYDKLAKELDKLAEELMSKFPALKGLIKNEIDKIKAKAEAALLGAWEELEEAIEAFWQRPDIEEFRHRVEDIAKTAYDGFDYAIDFIKANPNVIILPEKVDADGVHYTLSSNYDDALALPLFGIEDLGSTLDLIHSLGLELVYGIIDDAGGDFYVTGDKIIGTAAPGEYKVKVGWYLKYKNGNFDGLYKLAEETVTINVYSVTYEGGTNSLNPTKYMTADGEKTLVAPDTIAAGYAFGGWYEKDDATETVVSSIAAGSAGDKAYVAKWDVIEYGITY